MDRLKFDTLHKKPKVYNLAVLALIAAAAIAVIALTGKGAQSLMISIVLAVFYAASVASLVNAFFRQLRYNPYSYSTIYYAGFALFCFSLFILQVILTFRIAMYPDVYGWLEAYNTALTSAVNFVMLTFPFILLFSIALCVSNISLIRHEGKRFVNFLGILLSFLLVAGFITIFAFDFYVSGSQFEVMIHSLIVNVFTAAYLYIECMLIGTIIANIICVRYEPELNKDFLIILGCGIRKDGTPTPLLRGRIERAIAFYEKQKAETGKELIFITSGGQGPKEPISESASMKRYLIERGIPEDRIIEEDRSTDTMENMRFSKKKIDAVDPTGKVVFATTNYHVFRSGICARRVKMRAVGIGAKTKWYFWPNAAVREFAGLLAEHRGKQAMIFGVMLVFYIVMTILAYL